jgi:sugar phosphate isomerase/epimerase
MTDVELIAGTWATSGDAAAGTNDDRSPHPFTERITAAANAGFAGVGIGYMDLLEVKHTVGYSEIRKALDDSGMKYLELEMLLNWFVTDDRRAAADQQRNEMLRAAEALGARHIKVGGDFGGGPFEPDHMAEEFQDLAQEAQDAGTLVAFEPMPFVNVRTPQQALEFISKADHPAGGMLLDIWHVARAGVDVTSVKDIPLKYIIGVELDDAPLDFEGDIIDDTFHGRRLPGQGELDVAGFVASAKATGFDGPWSVEPLSEAYRKLPLNEACQAAFDTTASFLR